MLFGLLHQDDSQDCSTRWRRFRLRPRQVRGARRTLDGRRNRAAENVPPFERQELVFDGGQVVQQDVGPVQKVLLREQEEAAA